MEQLIAFEPRLFRRRRPDHKIASADEPRIKAVLVTDCELHAMLRAHAFHLLHLRHLPGIVL